MRTEQKIGLMFDIAERYAMEGTCPRMKGGAVIATPDYHVVTSGYNGAPSGLPQCDIIKCLIVDNHCIRASHAETNAIIQAAKIGVSIKGLVLYSTHLPCPWCTRVILQAGISKIRYLNIAPTYSLHDRDLVQEWCLYLRVEMSQWIRKCY